STDRDRPDRQNRPLSRSLAGRISRHVVHHPVRIVSTNSGGSFSFSISRASDSWSYVTGTNSTPTSRPKVRCAYQTLVFPSLAGRPNTPVFTTRRPEGRRRFQ